MTNRKLLAYLRRVGACAESIEWIGKRDLQKMWTECERADWMLWLLAHCVDRKELVKAACACARTALKYVRTGEEQPRITIETAEAWTRGEATIEQVRAAANATYATVYATTASSTHAYDAAYAAPTPANAVYAAAHAAYAASTHAAHAAYDAAYAAPTPANAVYAAAHAAYAAAASARHESHLEQCQIIREMFPEAPIPKKGGVA